jgi:hypothetical protein
VTSTPRPCGRGGVSVCPGAQALKTGAAPLVEASKLPDHQDGERALASEQPLSSAIHPDPGFVYIMTNAAMPGFVKIGITRKDDVSDRLRQLYTTGVALPFECLYSARVPDCGKLETVLHRVFGEKRVNPAREFFRADPDLAKLIIDLVKIEERPVSDAEQGITPEQRTEIEAEKERKAPRISFDRLGLPQGTVLALSKDPRVTCTVATTQTVLFNGEELSPSRAAVRAINALGHPWRAASGSEYWTYQGSKLSSLAADIANEAEREEGSAWPTLTDTPGGTSHSP